MLIPSYTSRPGRSKPVQGIVSYETPGLAEVLRSELVKIELRVDFGTQTRSTVLAIPDERGALAIKAAAWEDRSRKQSADKDAFDVWRCLELCYASGVQASGWPDAYVENLRRILSRDFGERSSLGLQALARFYSGDKARIVTRTLALCASVVGVQKR